ncbi:coiled-coil domain-containing protein 178 [Misgurnus anguillicaudatus]|uniref:coiled-coil domain-containing protein 178 n=1 Tax=Misgurnus anguillicaudatus TaxID=75329 RepID=UPI003CCF4599
MPEVKLLKPTCEGGGEGAFLQAQGELQAVCSSRRRSCALVNTPTPCVNKAVCHIRELKTKLENWNQKGGNAQHETENENNHSNAWKCISTDGGDSDVTADLCVEGLVLCANGGEVFTPLCRETLDVLAEVMCLIERLELDRRDAEKALLEEKEKAKKLLKRHESLAHWRQQEFPIVMQKERDACCLDIAELTWQLKIRRDQRPQVRDRLTQVEVLNRLLNEDIDFMRKHGPLVEERLQMENEIMKHIRTAESEASNKLARVSHDLEGFQLKFKEEKFTADTERQDMNKDIETIKNQLRDKLSELHHLQSQCEMFHRSIKKSKEEVTLRDSQIKAMLQEIRQFERQETDRNDAVMTLRANIEDKEELIMETKNFISQLQKQIQTTKGDGDEKVSELKALLSQKRQDLLALRANNEDHKLEIEDFKRRIHQSEQAVRQLQKDCEHLRLKLSWNEEQRKQAEAELERVSGDHSFTKDELEHLERMTFLEELRNRKQIESMKLQISNEMKTLHVLKESVATAAAELKREQTHGEMKKSELQKKFKDASSTTAQLETKVEHLRQIYTEKSQAIESLKAKISEVHMAHGRAIDELGKKRKDHQKYLNSVKESIDVVLLKSEQMSDRIKELCLKSQGLKKASDIMEKTINTMQDIKDELKRLSDTVAFKHETAMVVMGNLRRDLTSCEERKSRHAQIHSALFTQRQAVMKDTEANLQKALKDNLALAQEYKTLQKALMIARQEVVHSFDKSNIAEAYIQDHKQLSLLQKRMHKAMLKYFKQRSDYRRAALARFQAHSNQNNQKMKALQEELSNAIYRLSEFLLAPTDDSTGNRVPGQANGDAGRMPTVRITE